ncbi:hypothetical protein AFLA70_242g001710, partial [Aspergillus flavus AF70]
INSDHLKRDFLVLHRQSGFQTLDSEKSAKRQWIGVSGAADERRRQLMHDVIWTEETLAWQDGQA